jgi:hypothetical protein
MFCFLWGFCLFVGFCLLRSFVIYLFYLFILPSSFRFRSLSHGQAEKSRDLRAVPHPDGAAEARRGEARTAALPAAGRHQTQGDGG